MDSANIVDITKVCRTCLKEGDDMKSIFCSISQNIPISSMITICTVTKIKDSDKLPTQICNQCIQDVQISFLFKTQCEKAYDTLSKLFLNYENFPIDDADENDKATQTIESELTDLIKNIDKDTDIFDNFLNNYECKPEMYDSEEMEIDDNLIEDFAESEISKDNDSDEDYNPNSRTIKSVKSRSRSIKVKSPERSEFVSVDSFIEESENNLKEMNSTITSTQTHGIRIPNRSDEIELLMILKSWHLQELYKMLKENGVTYRSLKFLNFDDIKDVLPNNKIGIRAEFREKLLKWQKIEAKIPRPRPILPITHKQQFTPQLISSILPTVSSKTQITTVPVQPQIRSINSLQNNNGISPSDYQIEERDNQGDMTEFNLMNILRNTAKGKIVLAYFEHNNKLNAVCRSKLVEVIAEEYLRKHKTMSTKLFALITSEIVSLFPQEHRDTYYIPRKGTMQARGKLVHKYNNCARNMRQLGIIDSRYSKRYKTSSSTTNENSAKEEDDVEISANYISDEEYKKIKDWLYLKREPYSDVIERWKLSSYNRIREIQQNNDLSTRSILDNWPLYSYRYGVSLIDEDFETLDKVNSMNLLNKWDILAEKIIILAKSQVRDKITRTMIQDFDYNTDSITKDSKHFFTLQFLCALLIPKRTFKTKNKENYRPTINDVQNSMVLHIKTPGDYKTSIEEHRNKYETLGFPPYPILVVIGSDFKTITDFKVLYENITYDVQSFLKALDICFKMHYIFNIKYSCITELVWHFFQKHIYGIKTSIKTNYDLSHNASISAIITDLNSL